jgi:hypothetical protein
MSRIKKLYEVSVDIEERWMSPKKKEGQEFEYDKDYNRI